MFIVDSEQEAEGEPGKHALADGIVEKGKCVKGTDNRRFRFLYSPQESPS